VELRGVPTAAKTDASSINVEILSLISKMSQIEIKPAMHMKPARIGGGCSDRGVSRIDLDYISRIALKKDSLGTICRTNCAIFSEKGTSQRRRIDFVRQQEMAMAVSEHPEERHLVVEAGIGVGKSLAHLAPAILFVDNTKAIVSTHTTTARTALPKTSPF
jgi:hypothetical protein